MKIGVVGFGSFTRELIPRLGKAFDVFVSPEYIQKMDLVKTHAYLSRYNASIYSLDAFDKKRYSALISLTNGAQRETIVNALPQDTNYYTFIDKNAIVYDAENQIGKGSIICAGTVLTTNVVLDDFVQLNLNSTVGHDTRIGKYTTCAPGVNISGKCNIGAYTYLGTNSSIRENINIANHITIGAQTTVVKSLVEHGTYVGVPAKKLQ